MYSGFDPRRDYMSIYTRFLDVKDLVSSLEKLQKQGKYSSQESLELAQKLIGQAQQLEHQIWFARLNNRRFNY